MTTLRTAPVLRRLTFGLLALVAAALPGCIIGSVHVERETRSLQVSHAAAAPIVVRTENGSVSVVSDSTATDVSIAVELRAQTLQRLADTRIVATRDTDGTLRVGVRWPDDRLLDSEGCDFDIILPSASGVDIDSSNGRIRVEGLAGRAVLRTSNGRIVATRHAGTIDAGTSNGSISIVDAGGDVRADTSNGSIEVQNAPGRVEADTSNGRITVDLTDASPGPVVADTSNGSIRLVVGAAFTGRLSLDTSNGGVTLEGVDAREGIFVTSLDDSSAEITFGPTGDRSECRTSNGGITVQVRSK